MWRGEFLWVLSTAGRFQISERYIHGTAILPIYFASCNNPNFKNRARYFLCTILCPKSVYRGHHQLYSQVAVTIRSWFVIQDLLCSLTIGQETFRTESRHTIKNSSIIVERFLCRTSCYMYIIAHAQTTYCGRSFMQWQYELQKTKRVFLC